MQPPFSCTESTFCAIEQTLSPARLQRYMPAAGGNKHFALRLYVWNARLCEAFYLPTQLAEVSIRNVVHAAITDQYQDTWHRRGSFLCTLPDRLKTELNKVIADERAIHGLLLTNDHIVSGLSFGFWAHMFTANFEGILWPKYFPLCFPNKPTGLDRYELYGWIESLRAMRNRIAHHKPVFDKNPTAEYQNIIQLVSWICPDTAWFLKTTSHVSSIINARPRI